MRVRGRRPDWYLIYAMHSLLYFGAEEPRRPRDVSVLATTPDYELGAIASSGYTTVAVVEGKICHRSSPNNCSKTLYHKVIAFVTWQADFFSVTRVFPRQGSATKRR